MKVITGWGSHGKGGAIRRAVPSVMKGLSARGLAKEWIEGERWEIFNPTYLGWFRTCPELGRDRDLNRYNPGICWVRVR